MKAYSFKLRPLAPWATPWQADTIFGALCCEMRKLQGAQALESLLRRFSDGQPPFVISDAWPQGWFPRPLYIRVQPLPGLNFKAGPPGWIPEPQFCDLLRKPGPLCPQPAWPEPIAANRELHAALDRSTGTTGEGGNLFETPEWTFSKDIRLAAQNLMLYVRAGDSLDLVSLLVCSLAAASFGKRKSAGRGAFEVVAGPQPCEWMDEIPSSDSFVSLSHFIPAPADPVDGVWSLLTKYPKYAASAAGTIFKGRLTMMKPGSAFRVAGAVRPFYGRVLPAFHNELPHAIQYGLAFPVPACWPKDWPL